VQISTKQTYNLAFCYILAFKITTKEALKNILTLAEMRAFLFSVRVVVNLEGG